MGPSANQITATAINAMKCASFSATEDTCDISIIPLDFNSCNTLSIIENHSINLKKNEIIIGIFNEKTKDLVFLKIKGAIWNGCGTAPKKLSYRIKKWIS